MNTCPTALAREYTRTALASATCATHDRTPLVSCPVAKAKPKATTKPLKFVYNMLSYTLGFALAPARGFNAFVVRLTRSCNPPVTASMTSEIAMSDNPYALSFPLVFFASSARRRR